MVVMRLVVMITIMIKVTILILSTLNNKWPPARVLQLERSSGGGDDFDDHHDHRDHHEHLDPIIPQQQMTACKSFTTGEK